VFQGFGEGWSVCFGETQKNWYGGYTEVGHNAILGRVTDVEVGTTTIKIHLQQSCTIPQQRLNEMAAQLDIKCAAMTNELNITHWAIKRVNLVEVLKSAGFSIPAPF
jgi:hypothetical protein